MTKDFRTGSRGGSKDFTGENLNCFWLYYCFMIEAFLYPSRSASESLKMLNKTLEEVKKRGNRTQNKQQQKISLDQFGHL